MSKKVLTGLRKKIANADDAQLDQILHEFMSELSEKDLHEVKEVITDFLANQLKSQEAVS